MSHHTLELRGRAKALRDEAARLLEESRLLAVLEEFGKVQATGSFRHDLMLQPDVDLYLISPDAGRAHAKRILNRLIDQAFWNAYFFGDWVNFRHPDLPLGYYLGLKHTFGEHRWKIDIWDLPELPAESLAFDALLGRRLEDGLRDRILDLKDYRDANHLPVSSKRIYDLVLAGAARDRLSFREIIGTGDGAA